MNALPDVLNVTQFGLAIVFIWLFWQERIALMKCFEERVAEQKRHNDAIMALLLSNDLAVTTPQQALRRRFTSLAQWANENPPDAPDK